MCRINNDGGFMLTKEEMTKKIAEIEQGIKQRQEVVEKHKANIQNSTNIVNSLVQEIIHLNGQKQAYQEALEEKPNE
jgi:hypothetical protein